MYSHIRKPSNCVSASAGDDWEIPTINPLFAPDKGDFKQILEQIN